MAKKLQAELWATTEEEVRVGVYKLNPVAILLFVPLYIQNTRNKMFKAKILDGDKLAFLPEGVRDGDVLYSLDQIEAAVVYLESFAGFVHRERTTIGNTKDVADGDNNKMSFRYNGEVVDLVFCLADFSSYCAFKGLMRQWAAKGVNVVLQKVFEDDFIVQEMVHFSAKNL